MNLEILHPPEQIRVAADLIETIKTQNHLNFDLTLQLDYSMKESAGEYDPSVPNVIKVNPFLCTDESTFSYLEDNTLFGAVMHEFSHFLTMTYFVDFQKNYLEAFPENRLLVTQYEAASMDYDEEIAEICALFCRNPFLLKIVSKDHYKFFRAWFKSPVTSSQKHFIFMYNRLPIKCKNRLRTKWGIIVDHNLQKVYKIDKPHPEGFIIQP
jgi:hypothetical protein